MATAKPKVKRMMFGGAAKGMTGAGKGLGSAGKPSATPPAGLNVAGIKKASAGLGDTFPRKSAPPPAFPAKSGSGGAAAALRKLPMNPPMPGKTEPSLNDMRNAIEDTRRGKTIAGPMGTQLQALANSALKGGSSVGSQRALPAKPMKRGGAVKKKATKK